MYPQEVFENEDEVTVQDAVKSGTICPFCGLPTYLITVPNGPDDTDISEVCLRDGEL